MEIGEFIQHERIAQRFDQMLDQGFVREVSELKERYALTANMPSMRCVGYRQVWEHLAGETNFETMKEKGVAATRQLAKRQLTWLRSIPGQMQFDPLAPGAMDEATHWLSECVGRLSE